MSKKENTAQKRAFLRAIKQGLKEVKGGNTVSLNEARFPAQRKVGVDLVKHLVLTAEPVFAAAYKK